MGRLLDWLAKASHALALRCNPLVCEHQMRDAPPEHVGPLQSRFEVLRIHQGRKWSLYEGPSGARARDRFIAQRQKKAKGTTVLMMDGKPRDTITHPE